MTFEIVPMLLNVTGAIVAFLIGYAAKHWLDRAILPKVLDTIASMNKKMALRRAEKLLSRYAREKKIGQLQKISRKITDLAVILIVTSGKITILIIFSVGVILEGGIIKFGIENKGTSIILIVLIFSLLHEFYLMYRLVMSDLSFNTVPYAYGVAVRVVSLLRSAGLRDVEIHDWLEKDEDIRALSIAASMYQNPTSGPQ